ncbi:MAG: thiamine pyrophosphate-dependent dehydrogenase E1 component subunit alpha, partial [bacterium]|nr:thiamine pyrophosphate-dependent dehydrogenase E1 component subunit alpha [bacterium]
MAAPAGRQVDAELDVSGLAREDLVRAYRMIQTSRSIVDREILLRRQNKIHFQISGAGHEAIQTAAGMATRPGHDWFYPYYRDRALALTLGVTAEEMFLQAVGSAEDTASGGRQMPTHWSSPELHIVTTSSTTGTQFLPSVGCAHASKLLAPDGDDLTLVCGGDGHTSEGEFWEAINASCLEQLRIVFLIEDNGYSISTPVECQTAGGSISKLLASFPGLLIEEVDGTNFVASYVAMKKAVEYTRAGMGPALVHAHVTRPYSHSLSDDETAYKPSVERAAEAERDPVVIYPRWMVEEEIIDASTVEEIAREIDLDVQQATERASKSRKPEPGSATRYVYSDTVDPTSAAFATEPEFTGPAIT